MRRRDFLQGPAAARCALSGSLFGASLHANMTPGFRPSGDRRARPLGPVRDEESETQALALPAPRSRLNAYVNSVACKVAGGYCRDLRIYIVRSPFFNATMAPNGMMQIWTGTLLRCQSEAQLAAVIGHEIGHYLRRHGVDRFRDAQVKSNISLFVGLGLSVVSGGGRFSALADALLLATSFAYSREQEREADSMGMQLCSGAGYDPEEAANVWAHLLAERKARENQGFRDLVFASHPTEEEREETLRALSKGLEGCGLPARRCRDRYLGALRRERASFFADELRLRDYGPSLALFERMAADDKADREVLFNLGEVYRLRARDGDDAMALEAFGGWSHDGAPGAWRLDSGWSPRARLEAQRPEAFSATRAHPRRHAAIILATWEREGDIGCDLRNLAVACLLGGCSLVSHCAGRTRVINDARGQPTRAGPASSSSLFDAISSCGLWTGPVEPALSWRASRTNPIHTTGPRNAEPVFRSNMSATE